jgi:hypothetical protein
MHWVGARMFGLVHGVSQAVSISRIRFHRWFPAILCAVEQYEDCKRIMRLISLIYQAGVVLLITQLQRLLAERLEEFLIDATQCHSGSIESSGLLSTLYLLGGYNPRVLCPVSGGIQAAGTVVSRNSVASLSRQLSNRAFSVELWMQPKRYLVNRAPILAFGSDRVSAYPCANNFVVR